MLIAALPKGGAAAGGAAPARRRRRGAAGPGRPARPAGRAAARSRWARPPERVVPETDAAVGHARGEAARRKRRPDSRTTRQPGHGGQGQGDRREAGRSDAAGARAFHRPPAGSAAVGAAVMEWRGLRLGTVPFAMPDSGGARAEIRALARTADPSVVRRSAPAAGSSLQMMQDALVVLEFLPLENNSDKMFDPGPGRHRDPAAERARGRPGQGGGSQARGPQGPRHRGARPDRPAAVDHRRRRQDRRAGGGLPVRRSPTAATRHDFEQPMPNGIGPFTLIIDQKMANLTASGPGVGAREERTLGGKKYWVMAVDAIPAGGTLKFTLPGLPSTRLDRTHRRRRAVDPAGHQHRVCSAAGRAAPGRRQAQDGHRRARAPGRDARVAVLGAGGAGARRARGRDRGARPNAASSW